MEQIRYNEETHIWEVLIKWRDYDKSENSWEPAISTISDNQVLVPGLLNNSRLAKLPDLNKPPVKRRKITKKHVKNIECSLKAGCPLKGEHASRDLKTKMKCLVEEDNRLYIKPGYYLHENHCQKCGKIFVLKLLTRPQK